MKKDKWSAQPEDELTDEQVDEMQTDGGWADDDDDD